MLAAARPPRIYNCAERPSQRLRPLGLGAQQERISMTRDALRHFHLHVPAVLLVQDVAVNHSHASAVVQVFTTAATGSVVND